MGIGDFVTKVFGSKNTAKATGRQVDPNAYQYGGAPGGAEAAANGYAAQGAVAQGRQATQTPTVGVNYGAADIDRAAGMQARRGQNTLADLMSQRAQGLAGPSIAQMQADRQMQQAQAQADRQMQQSQAQQASLAGSARGAGGLAAAQRNAAFNMANNTSDISGQVQNAARDISGQAQINGASERRDDTNAAAGIYSNLRGGDLASQGQNAGQAQFRTQNSVQQNQFNANLRDAQAARNDQMQMGYDQLGNQVRTTQLAAQMNQQGQQSANDLGAQGINAGVGGQNASMNQANAMNLIGMGQNIAGGVASFATAGGTPAARERGGPTSEGKPYLVGEQGPELVVPKKDGFVLTAGQTQQALAGAPPKDIMSLFDRGHAVAPGASLASIMGARAGGGYMPARAEGGPVMGGGDRDAVGNGWALPPSPDANAMPGYAPPVVTWGNGPPIDPDAARNDAIAAQRARMAPYDDLAARIATQRQGINATAGRVNETVAAIDQRDKDAIWNADYKDRHGQPLSREEDDASTEARYRQSEDGKQKTALAKAQRKRSLVDALTGDGGKQSRDSAAGVDTAYHGGGGHYVPPQLIPISGARALGGPMSAGGLVPLNGPGVGVGGGIEFGGGGISHNDLLRAGSGLATQQPIPGMVGGGGITGGSSMGGAPIPGIAGAREEGGPVSGSDPLPKKLYDPTRPEGERFVPTTAGALAKGAEGSAELVPQTKAERITKQTKDDADSMAKLAQLMGFVAPGLSPVVAANALGVGASGQAMSSEDEAARHAREEQAAIEAERAEMARADRGGGPAVAPRQSLWDLLRGK